jgi:hypothetical protein
MTASRQQPETTKLTVRVDPDLLRKARIRALEEKTTLRAAITRMVEDYVRQPAASRPAPTRPGPGRPRPRPRPKDDDDEDD